MKPKKKETRKCTIPGCGKTLLAKGMCSMHYMQERGKSLVTSCSVKGCEGSNYSHGYCTKHYQRYIKYGDPLLLRKIPGNMETLERPAKVES